MNKSRALNINLSATLESALQARLAQVSAENRASENRNVIRAYNQFIEEHGCFGEEYREF